MTTTGNAIGLGWRRLQNVGCGVRASEPIERRAKSIRENFYRGRITNCTTMLRCCKTCYATASIVPKVAPGEWRNDRSNPLRVGYSDCPKAQ